MFSAALSWFDRPRRDRQSGEPLPVPQLDPDWPHCLADPTPQFVPVTVARPDDEPAMDAPAAAPAVVDACTPPDAEAMATGHWACPDLTAAAAPTPTVTRTAAESAEGVQVTLDNREVVVGPPAETDLAAAARQADWPTPAPDYSRTSTGRVLAGIDEVIAGPLAERLRKVAEDRYARAEAARVEADSRARTAEGQFALEKSLRQDTQVRLVQAETERDAALKRVAELELTVRALGGLVAHAAGHDTPNNERGITAAKEQQ